MVEILSDGISPKIYTKYQHKINSEQLRVITHKNGPLLVKSGPGSGKTYSLILLAMNLLLCQHAQPHEIILCTYTEKAAREMQDRLYSLADEIEYTEDLSRIHVGTIHSICNYFVSHYLHYTPFVGKYEILDNFTQQFTIYQNLSELCSVPMLRFFSEQWGSLWDISKKLGFFFDRISEELIFDSLKADFRQSHHGESDNQRTLRYLSHAYSKYQNLLLKTNSIDFAHLQKCMLNLLQKPITRSAITKNIRYVLVDEYQDTNHIQQEILYLLASFNENHNLCVVGDEDQALYRFRGATLHNMKSFAQRYPDHTAIELTINYRSHATIINTYNQWINETNWIDTQGKQLERTSKIVSHSTTNSQTNSVFTLTASDPTDEAQQFASLIFFLKKQHVIQHYGQVVLLLSSVRSYISGVYQQALHDFDIPVFCPRAKNLFDQDEIKLIIACLATILHYEEDFSEDLPEQNYLFNYMKDCLKIFYNSIATYPALDDEISQIEHEILYHSTFAADIPERHLSDYFYRLIFTDPLKTMLEQPQKVSNLVIFSNLLNTFYRFYPHRHFTQQLLPTVQRDFFHIFLCLLHSDGLNQFDDIAEPPPPGHIQIMTIHQAKGLEFPVVFVGNMHKLRNSTNDQDKILRPYYHRVAVEPENMIPQFDMRRLYYVAFSRAQQILFFMAQRKSSPYLASLWTDLPSWQKHCSISPVQNEKQNAKPKSRFSFTSHILTYEICPRRFQYLREHRFISTHSTITTYGKLVHQALEYIHKAALANQLSLLDTQSLHQVIERIHAFLLLTNHQPLSDAKKEQALLEIHSYWLQNQRELSYIRDAEYDIRIEKPSYILTGTIDLLLEKKSGIEIIDFKTDYRPQKERDKLTTYKQQLYLYAYAIAKQTGQMPSRLAIYWTSEKNKSNALMEIPCTSDHLEQATTHFDRVVTGIQSQNFAIDRLPSPQTCQKCDIRYLCQKEGLISLSKSKFLSQQGKEVI